jgi:peptidoglycan hydrolase CwlO-like protein
MPLGDLMAFRGETIMRRLKGKTQCLLCLYFMLLSLPTNSYAEVWDSHCARAIDDLKKAQQEVSGAQEKLESAKNRVETDQRMLEICLGDCRHEREMLNMRTRDYNECLRELKNTFSNFESAVQSFRRNCFK